MDDNTLQLNETDIDEIQHNSIKLSGTFTALVTPFTKDGNVDYDGLSSIVEFQIKEGIDGLLAVGTTGESPTLSWDEHLNIIQTVHECGGNKIKIIAGKYNDIEGPGRPHTKMFYHDVNLKQYANFNLQISFDLTAIESVNRRKVLSKTFSISGSYKASDLYSNTLNREKKIINELTERIATQILTDLNLAYGEK